MKRKKVKQWVASVLVLTMCAGVSPGMNGFAADMADGNGQAEETDAGTEDNTAQEQAAGDSYSGETTRESVTQSSVSEESESAQTEAADTPVVEEAQKNQLEVQINETETEFTVRITNAETGDSGKILFPVWGEKNGQNDIVWYTAHRTTEGGYEATVKIANHKESGKYLIHAYTSNGGKMVFLGKTEVNISGIKMESITCNEEQSSVADGSYRIELKGVSVPCGVTRVRVPVWSERNGQDDLIWYEAKQDGDLWYIDLRVPDHKYDTGTYMIHSYATDARGITEFLGSMKLDVGKMDVNHLSVEMAEDETSFNVRLSKATVKNFGSVRFPVWGKTGGQNDLVWYTASRVSDGVYEAKVPVSKHRETGEYLIHAYGVENGKLTFLTSGSVSVTPPEATVSLNEEKSVTKDGKYRIEISDIQCPASVQSVQVPVWSDADGQDDIRWYEAKKDGSVWCVDVDISLHRYDAGIYHAHVYTKDARGIFACAGKTDFTVTDEIEKNHLDITVNDAQSQITVILKHASTNGKVLFPVWGEKNGQNDLVWYTAEKTAPYTYKKVINISDHKETGKYKIHCYGSENGKSVFLTSGETEIEGITGTLETTVDQDSGIIEIKVADLSAPSEITSVQVPVWSEKNGQDDLVWYTASKKEDGWYVTVDTWRHKQEAGNYKIHVYASDGRGFRQFVTSGDAVLEEVPVKLTAELGSDGETVSLKATGVRDASKVRIAVWGATNGQDDLVWYGMSRSKGLVYERKISVYDHLDIGEYNCHLYVTGSDGKQRFAAKTTFQVDELESNHLWISDVDNTNGRFTAKIYNPSAEKGISQILMAVWTESGGQDDIHWYTASKGAKNVWSVRADSLNHKCETGNYIIHVYAKASDGTMQFLKSTKVYVIRTTRRYQNPSGYFQIKDSITLSGGGYNLSVGYEGVKVMMVIRKLGLGTGIGMGGALYTQSVANAVARFQRNAGLSATGVVDYLTWVRLGFNELQWNQWGAYVSPVKVNKNSTRAEHIEAMISTAYSYLGNAYVIGASGPPGTGVDCSGLVMQALYGAGLDMGWINPVTHALPGHEYESRNMWNASGFMHVAYSQRQRGDLIFYQNSSGVVIHVAIYLGNDQVIESWPNKVVVWPIKNSSRSNIKGVVRPFI